MQIGLIGLGAIGQFVLEQLNAKQRLPDCEVIAALDERDRTKAERTVASLGVTCPVYDTLTAFLGTGVQLVVEAAGTSVAAKYAPQLLAVGIPVVLCSSGCLAEEATLSAVTAACRAGGVQCHVPSGAIGGLDLLQAANALGGLTSVSITTRKPPQSLAGGGDGATTAATVAFKGAARDAIVQFPRNVNSSVALSLAGIGSERTEVQIVQDPAVDRNTHEICAVGDFGDFSMTVRNVPMPTNPRTSYLAALSVLSTLAGLSQPIRVGG